MKVLINLLIAMAASLAAMGQQPKVYQSCDIVYVENSRLDTEGGLSGEQIVRLTELMDSLKGKPNHLFHFIITNGIDPQLSGSPDDAKLLINELWASNFAYPLDKQAELKRLSEILFENPVLVSSQIRFHYFTTNDFTEAMAEKWPFLVSYLPNAFQMAAASVTAQPLEVNIYIDENKDPYGGALMPKLEKPLGHNRPLPEFKLISL